MTDSNASPASDKIELTTNERRVLGVLIEKGLTTPEYYPMTLNAIVAGCNQKNNRDPITHYEEEQVESTLESLQKKGVVLSIWPASGRAVRWKEELTKKYQLSGVELAVIGELLLRGAQTEGELRSRASRMRPIADLDALQEILAKLRTKTPPFVVRLSPVGSVRGVRVTHALYPPAELDCIVADDATHRALGGDQRDAPPPEPQSTSTDLDDLRARIAALEERVARLEGSGNG